jgi:hypothetical protein
VEEREGAHPAIAATDDAVMEPLFRGLTRFFALFVFSLLAAILVSLAYGATLSIQKFGFGFLLDGRMESGDGGIRGARAHRRHARHFVHRPRDRDPGELRHRDLPHRALARVLRRPLGTAIEMLAAIPQHHLRDVGASSSSLRVPGARPAAHRQDVGRDPGIGCSFPGRRWGSAMLTGGHHPRGDGDPVHHRGDARRLRARAGDAQGIVVRARLDDLGSGLARGAALHEGGVIGGIMLGLGARSARRWR